MAAVAATVWLAADLASGHPHSGAVTPFWNALVRLGFFLVTARLLSEVRALLKHEQLLARSDPLTGLLNPRAFAHEATKVLALARRHQHLLSLLYVDVDDFKRVNDRLGHETGDRLLRRIAHELAGGVRASDLLARVGGDEFAVLLPETDARGARAAASAPRKRLRRVTEAGVAVTLSIGAASFAAIPPTLDELIRIADDLMHEAKARGKDAVVERSV
jgi:diguanylate cyclase (GGDEF)-like protein